MSRLPAAAGAGEVAQRIRERRGGELHSLDEQLLHSEPIAAGWNELLRAIRKQTILDPLLRELVILRIAVLNKADYEWNAHEPIARSAGATVDQLDALREAEFSPKVFSELSLAALQYTDAMTLDVEVGSQTFDILRPLLDERGIIELTATIAAYNMVSRFLVALEVS